MASETTPKPTDSLASLRIDRAIKNPPPRTRRFKSFLKWLFLLLVVFGCLFGAGIYFGWVGPEGTLVKLDTNRLSEKFALPDAIRNRPEVRVVRPVVEKGRAAEASVVASGYLESRRQAKIGARAVGRVQSVSVEEGSKVVKDQVLAVLEHADLDASLAATDASVARSKAAIQEQRVLIQQTNREFERAKNLFATRSISATEYDKARFDFESAEARLQSLQAEVELAEARLREAQQLKENMFIRAPFDGTVISKDAEVGESIMPGGMGEASGRGSAVTIADLQHLEADCDVKEDYISRIKVGQPTEIAVDAVPQRRYHGTVRKIIPMGDRARATIKVKVSITDLDDRLFPNMSSTVYFLPESNTAADADSDRPRMFIPVDCVVKDQDQFNVWLADDQDHAIRQNVEIGATRDGRTEITGGLQSDARVIVKPQSLTANQPLRVVQ